MMHEDRIRELVGDLADNLSSVGSGEEDFLVGRAWAEELVAAVFWSDGAADRRAIGDELATVRMPTVGPGDVIVGGPQRLPTFAHAPAMEPDCTMCGETYPPEDATYSDQLGAEVCVSCADRLGLLT